MAFAAKNNGRRTDAATQSCVRVMLMYSYSIAFVSQKTRPAYAHAVNRHEMSPRMPNAKLLTNTAVFLTVITCPYILTCCVPVTTSARARQGAEANAPPLRVAPDGVIVFHSQLSISKRVALRIQCVSSARRQARRTAALKTNEHAHRE